MVMKTILKFMVINTFLIFYGIHDTIEPNILSVMITINMVIKSKNIFKKNQFITITWYCCKDILVYLF